ncbi:C4-dicarboxylate ABC transporter substrate-binding protein [Hahella sp. CCB-MM4]|uniref:TAXI family TRAP transporter solute-binding subunit n=1 Tax=Hahella sp. (strain CCB-MM4) TaxID=1926491 RepID=UPI000B9A69D3|nr:TAXI family TRAP transporter solute-binding subunit [Hahella sp. CCB-MM4]OZG74002.1 C4-dicarboxylate ABC transporter substrate-binding protein [Hahella sp. CCB-MM4]
MKRIVIGVIFVLLGMPWKALAADVTHVTIATGNETGVYFPAGGAICRLVNKNSKENGFRCYVESTEGSPFNLRALRSGEVDFAVVQSDWQYHAYYGSSIFKEDGPDKNLRSVFAIHPEAFTVVARADAKIKSFEDIKGKRVNVGSEGTGQRSTLEVLMKAYGWTFSDFKEAREIKAIEQPRALCSNDIDVMLYVVGHPSGAVKEATTLCDSVLVPVKGPQVDKLIKSNTYYRHATIPMGMYRGTDYVVDTFGVGATFVTSSETSDEVVYAVVKAVFENFDLFRRLHPALANLKKEQMVLDSLTAPLHPGAEKYYREIGLLNQ